MVDKKGKVWLVGAGPGDIGLLTVKGKQVLESAEVVVYDALVSDEIASLIPSSAKRINVGKRANHHLVPQVENNIPYEIVPGITSAVSVPAYAGIPVTHRDYTSSVHIITGHAKKGGSSRIQYDALVKMKATLIFLMGIGALEEICKSKKSYCNGRNT